MHSCVIAFKKIAAQILADDATKDEVAHAVLVKMSILAIYHYCRCEVRVHFII